MNFPLIHFYCDESCHLPMKSDGRVAGEVRQVMAIGGIWCEQERVRELVARLRDLKEEHGLGRTFELKWKKVSPLKLELFRAWLDFFFSSPDLHFRAAVMPDKARFFASHRERSRGGDSNSAYYSCYFDVLKVVLDPRAQYNFFLDAKDTRGRFKLDELRQKLADNEFYEVPPHVVGRLQEIRSHESDLMQLADILLGVLTFAHRDLEEVEGTSPAKSALVELVRQRSGYSLEKSTLPAEPKFNLWVWHSSHRPGESDDNAAKRES